MVAIATWIGSIAGSISDPHARGDNRLGRPRRRAGRGGAPNGAPFGGNAGGQLPYWGKYVYHDNNRDINLSQMSMRAITDWYFTAHPPIIHDLHEAQPLLYTYSGGPPQNPNLDPLLFAELPWFSNWELAQMTKWGMPGVYTLAFMDGWSPGYLGSVAYNHNGMMRMYETQSGAKADPAADGGAAVRGGARRAAGGGGGGAWRARWRWRCAGNAGPSAREAASVRRRSRSVPTGRGGGQPREWYRGIPIPPNGVQNFTRRNNTNYMETGVLSALQLTSMFPNLILENFYVKTKHSMEAGSTSAPFGYVIPDAARHDARRRARQCASRAGNRSRHAQRRRHRGNGQVSGGLVSHQDWISRTAAS